MDGQQGALVHSLRFRLSLWLSVTIVLIAAAAGTFSFLSSLEEAHRMQDNQLRQTAFLISQLDAVPSSPRAREQAGDVDFHARLVVRFLPPGGQRPATEQVRRPIFPPGLADGLQTVQVDGEAWRVYVRTNPKGVRVAVAQQTTVRDALARSSALRTLAPILLLVPVLVFLVGILIRQMFRPLRALANELGERPDHDLSTLSAEGVPSEIRPFVGEINALLGRVSDALKAQRRFIADAAHELRSPMTALSLQAERLRATAMPDEARSRLDALTSGLRRTRAMLEQLLTLARSQEPAHERTASVVVDQAIREVLEDLISIAEEKNIDLGVVGAVKVEVRAEAVDVKVLIKNLVDNAIRYTPPNGRVDITVEKQLDQARLVVEDSGPGIADDELERVFDPFYRVLGNDEVGSGLGLAIAKSVAERIGAHIELRNVAAPGHGLRAIVTFATTAALPNH